MGSPLYSEFVTSYKVFYSLDGSLFHPVLNEKGLPQIFRGSIDCCTAVRQIFDTPIEAKVLKINPQTWQNGISLRVELIGCGEVQTTAVPYEFITISTAKPKFCKDPMGLEDNTMSDQQVSVSSELDQNHGKKYLKLNSTNSWQPLSNSPTEFVQFDFLEPRNITSLVTKGGPNGWVTSFTVLYSHDQKDWNPVLDNTKEKIFIANFDSKTPQTNNFDIPIGTRFIKVVPVKWQNNIQMRIEIYGCFKPYRM